MQTWSHSKCFFRDIYITWCFWLIDTIGLTGIEIPVCLFLFWLTPFSVCCSLLRAADWHDSKSSALRLTSLTSHMHAHIVWHRREWHGANRQLQQLLCIYFKGCMFPLTFNAYNRLMTDLPEQRFFKGENNLKWKCSITTRGDHWGTFPKGNAADWVLWRAVMSQPTSE